ncbi:unnamed protein product [Ectocarpus sp. 8 AP-2014]
MVERKRRAAGANLQIAGFQIPGFQSPGCPSDEDELLYADEEDAGPDTLANAIFSRLFCVAFDRCVYPPAWIYEDELDSKPRAPPPLSDHNSPGEIRARSTSGDNESGEVAAEDTKPLYDVTLEDDNDNDDNTKTMAMRPGNPWRTPVVAPPPSPLAQSPRRRSFDDHAARVASTALMGDLDEWPLTVQAPPSDPHRRRSEPHDRRSAVAMYNDARVSPACSSRNDRGSRSSRSSSNGSNDEDPKIMRGAPWRGDDYLTGYMPGGVGGTD